MFVDDSLQTGNGRAAWPIGNSVATLTEVLTVSLITDS